LVALPGLAPFALKQSQSRWQLGAMSAKVKSVK
jgi:hypothetical protein